MASRFRREQRRKRWCDTGTVFPPYYVQSATDLLSPESSSFSSQLPALAQEILRLTALGTTYGEIAHMKALTPALGRLWSEAVKSGGGGGGGGGGGREEASNDLAKGLRLYVEILFLENSRPLHRSLLAYLAKFPRSHLAILDDAIWQCCHEYSPAGAKYRRFSVCEAAASITAAQFQVLLDGAGRKSAQILAVSLSSDVACALEVSRSGSRLTPGIMDSCQEALSAIYYLLQRFPEQFIPSIDGKGERKVAGDAGKEKDFLKESSEEKKVIAEGSLEEDNRVRKGKEVKFLPGLFGEYKQGEDCGPEFAVKAVVNVLLDVLKMGVLTQDCSVAASVGLCAAIQLSGSPLSLSLYLANSFFAFNWKKDLFSLKQSRVDVEGILDSEEIGVENSSFIVSDNFHDLHASKEERGSLEKIGQGRSHREVNNVERKQELEFRLLEEEKDKGGEDDIVVEVVIKQACGSSLREEGESFAEFSQLCWLRGLLTAIPREALCANLLCKDNSLSEENHENGDSGHLSVLEASVFLNGNETLEFAGSSKIHDAGADVSNNVSKDGDKCANKDKNKDGNEDGSGSGNGSKVGNKDRVWTLLFDGILPRVCEYCEISTDGHFKFHAVTCLQICLQQMKSALLSGTMTDASATFENVAFTKGVKFSPYEAVPGTTISRVLQIVWNNWEDPVTQTVKQVQTVFDLLVDMVQVLTSARASMARKVAVGVTEKAMVKTSLGNTEENSSDYFDSEKSTVLGQEQDEEDEGPSVEDLNSEWIEETEEEIGVRSNKIPSEEENKGSEMGRKVVVGKKESSALLNGTWVDTKLFLERIANDLLSAGGHRKGRYVPLASLALKIGALKLIQMDTYLLHETIAALSDDGVCCSVSSFLRAFLERLRDECQKEEGGALDGDVRWRSLWVPPVLNALLGEDPKLRANVTTYALPVVLLMDRDSLWPMVAFILDVEYRKKVETEKFETENLEAENLETGRGLEGENGETSMELDDGENQTGSFEEVGEDRRGYSKRWERELAGASGLPVGASPDQRIGGLISILKVARILALIDGGMEQLFEEPKWERESGSKKLILGPQTWNSEHDVEEEEEEDEEEEDEEQPRKIRRGDAEDEKGRGIEKLGRNWGRIRIPFETLYLSMIHKDDGLRVDAAELLCLNPKTSAMPLALELKLLQKAIPLNLRCTSTAFRMRWTSLMKKFFVRIQNAIERKRVEALKRAGVEGTVLKREGGMMSHKSPAVKLKTASVEKRKMMKKWGFVGDGGRDGVWGGGGHFGEGEEDAESEKEASVSEVEEFMCWLTRLLVNSLYPGAPYERKNMAMELYNAIIEVWSPVEAIKLLKSEGSEKGELVDGCLEPFIPFEKGLFSKGGTLALIGAAVDSWDRLREGAFTLLLKYPVPFPGVNEPFEVEAVLRWVKNLIVSPRVREADAGALILRLFFRKYVIELGWTVKMHPEPKVVVVAEEKEREKTEGEGRGGGLSGGGGSFDKKDDLGKKINAMWEYIESLNDWLEGGVEEGERDLVRACEHSLVHGVLLTIRYSIGEIDWVSITMKRRTEKLKQSLERMLSLLLRVTSLALWVVSVDALKMPKLGEEEEGTVEEEEEGREDENSQRLGEGGVGENGLWENGLIEEWDENIVEEGERLAPKEQMVMVGCWLSMKEVSLLLGSLARAVPLGESAPQNNNENIKGEDIKNGDDKLKEEGSYGFSSDAELVNTGEGEQSLLNAQQLEVIGQHFLRVLLAMKHNGAIDKTRAGFIALSERLLRTESFRLNRLPESWLLEVMKHTSAKGQTVDNLLRRSAGIPSCFLALFLSEPDGSPKKLLPMGMNWLLRLANHLLDQSDVSVKNGELEKLTASLGNVEITSEYPQKGEKKETKSDSEVMIYEVDMNGGSRTDKGIYAVVKDEPSSSPPSPSRSPDLSLKIRVEGVVPTVHAFNTLRVAFNDTNLATETSSFCAEGLNATIRAFSSPHWEVRNSACLAFTSLVNRTIGFLNILQKETARRALTGFEFFHRYPSLHPFLFDQLQTATSHLEDPPSANRTNSSSKPLHPSLCPILILLSRLKPSVINTKQDDWLSPSSFLPLISRCALQSNLQVRALASRAFAPLVPSQEVTGVLLKLARSLPLSLPLVSQTKLGTEQWANDGGIPLSALSCLTEKCSVDSEEVTEDKKKFIGMQKEEEIVPGSNSGLDGLISFNTIHGTLLQMRALLMSAKSSITDHAVQGKVVRILFPELQARAWLGNPHISPCYLVAREYLRILEVLGEISEGLVGVKKGGQTMGGGRSEEVILSHNVLAFVSEMAEISLTMEIPKKWGVIDATAVDLREHAASIYFKDALFSKGSGNEVLGKWKDGSFVSLSGEDELRGEGKVTREENFNVLVSRVKDALEDKMYEVRLATLKILKKVPLSGSRKKYSGKVQSLVVSLEPILVDRLVVEKHPQCLRRILQVMFAWKREVTNSWNQMVKNSVLEFSDDFANGDLAGGVGVGGGSQNHFVSQLWNKIFKTFESARQIKTKEVALKCLGVCLRNILPSIKMAVLSTWEEKRVTVGDRGEFIKERKERNGREERNAMKWEDAEAILDSWQLLIGSHSKADQPATFRRATAEALIASNMLNEGIWVKERMSEEIKRIEETAGWKSDLDDNRENLRKSREGLDGGERESKRRECTGQRDRRLEKYSETILRIWTLCVRMLEDEDVELRQRLATAMQEVIQEQNGYGNKNNVLGSFRGVELLSTGEIVSEEGGKAVDGGRREGVKKKTEVTKETKEMIPSQEERVLELSFRHMSKCFGNCGLYFDILAEWVMGPIELGRVGGHDLDLVKRLFDKEIDNHHEEDMLFVQLACLHLRRMRQKNQKNQLVLVQMGENPVISSENGRDVSDIALSIGDFHEKVKVWEMRFLNRLEICVKLVVKMDGRMEWVGGVTNHPDAFMLLYRSLLGLLTFSGQMRGQEVKTREEVKTRGEVEMSEEVKTRDEGGEVKMRGEVTNGGGFSVNSEGSVTDKGELARRIRELTTSFLTLPLHSLIGNILFMVLEEYESNLQEDLGSVLVQNSLGTLWSRTFNPIFLLL